MALRDFQAELQIDTQRQVFDPGFNDMLRRDYRLQKPETMAAVGDCYPQGPVPGVLLGTVK